MGKVGENGAAASWDFPGRSTHVPQHQPWGRRSGQQHMGTGGKSCSAGGCLLRNGDFGAFKVHLSALSMTSSQPTSSNAREHGRAPATRPRCPRRHTGLCRTHVHVSAGFSGKEGEGCAWSSTCAPGFGRTDGSTAGRSVQDRMGSPAGRQGSPWK